MAQIEVTPCEVRSVGAAIASKSGFVASVATDVKGLGGDVSEPVRTASALDAMANLWSTGVQRLAEDVRRLGALTQAVAGSYVETDQGAVPPLTPLNGLSP